MDERRFDNVTRTAGAARTRRAVLGGLLAAAFGGGAAAVAPLAGAQGVGTRAFDLTCRQAGVQNFCQANAADVTRCGPAPKGCVCAQLRAGKSRCVEQPKTGCPTRKTKCKRNNQCGRGEVCIRVPDCCSNNPAWGKCVPKCPGS